MSQLTTTDPLAGGDPVWESNRAAFEAMRPKLFADPRYRGRFVAISGNCVVDADEDEFQLARRVLVSPAAAGMYIGKVEETSEALDLPSPEVAD